MRLRVVCGLCVTIASFSPTNALSSVDLPALGRPMMETNPERNLDMDLTRAKAHKFMTAKRGAEAPLFHRMPLRGMQVMRDVLRAKLFRLYRVCGAVEA